MTRRRASLLFGATLCAVVTASAPATAQVPSQAPRVTIVVVRGLSYAEVSSVPAARSLAARPATERLPSGAALLVPQGSVDRQIERIADAADAAGDPSLVRIAEIQGPIERARDRLTEALGESASLPGALIVVVGAEPSAQMVADKDDVLPLFVGPSGAAPGGTARALTSSSTRRDGVVSSLDLFPTVLAAAGLPLPEGGSGERIRSTSAGAPDALYDRYLQMRRLTVPIQTAAWIYTALAGAVLGTLMSVRARDPRRVSDRVVCVARWVALSVVPLAVAMLAAGHLPSLTYAVVVPFLVVVTVGGTVALVPSAARGRLAPLWVLGSSVLALVVLETALGWTAALTPLLGGSQLDGGRFFGMPNVASGIVIGSAVYAATRSWGSGAGAAAFVVALALIALPWTGANIGAGVATVAAGALWVVQQRRGRLDLAGIGVAAAVTVVGAVAILALYRFAPGAPSHGADFAAGTLGSPIGVALDRLRVGFDLLVRSPAAVLPVVGIVLLAVIGFRPPRSVAPAFRAEPALRALVLSLALSGIVAYLIEDSGAGASGMFFAFGLAAVFHVSLPVAGREDRTHR